MKRISAAEKGISNRFLNYFQSLDSSIGAKALGPDQTISGKVTSTIQTATQHAKTVDEQKGYSKVAGDVCRRTIYLVASANAPTHSTTHVPWVPTLVNAYVHSTQRPQSRSSISTRRPVALQTSTRLPNVPQSLLVQRPQVVRPMTQGRRLRDWFECPLLLPVQGGMGNR